MKIRYTPRAVDDLREIQRYLIDAFDEETARRVTGKIVSEISTLKEFPCPLLK